jgi:hypothetical protein
MVKRKRQKNRQHDGQKKKTEEQTTRWLKEKDRRTDNTMVKRKILLTIVLSVLLSFSFDHRVVCFSVFFF